MSETVAPRASRRQALKFLSAAPMLPLGGVAFLTACGGGSDDPAPTPAPAPAPSPAPAPAPKPNYVSATFTGMAAPALSDSAAMATTSVGSTLKITYDNGTSTDYALAYKPFFITGDRVPDGKGGTILAGGYVDIYNQPIVDTTVPASPRQFFSDAPDGTSLLSVAGAKVEDRKSTRLNSSHSQQSRMPSSA